ncbi:MAG: hypothetical protein C0434_10780 [Xanthomonadaceae bacterium]|nr:hypothetical protein [Xanthomonadaceae bacterium]
MIFLKSLIAMLAVGPIMTVNGQSAADPHPADHLRAAKAGLGARLFSDASLSADGKVSCASCHLPDHGFSDRRAVSIGVNSRTGTRNAPDLATVGSYRFFSWDGRASTLEAQVLMALLDPFEHGFESASQLLEKLDLDKTYPGDFSTVFGSESRSVTIENFLSAITSYIRSLESSQDWLDRYIVDSSNEKVPEITTRGLEVFRNIAGCSDCHTITDLHAPLTDNGFHEGVARPHDPSMHLADVATQLASTSADARDRLISGDPAISDLGRFVVTLNPDDIGKFRTPSLRNVASTGPYMHDGSIESLEEAIDWELYRRGAASGRAIVLTPQDRSALIAFLKSLTNRNHEPIVNPEPREFSHMVPSTLRSQPASREHQRDAWSRSGITSRSL